MTHATFHFFGNILYCASQNMLREVKRKRESCLPFVKIAEKHDDITCHLVVLYIFFSVSTKPEINLKEIELERPNEKLFLPDPATDEKLWTKIMDWVDVDVRAGAVYSFTPGTLPHYITDVTIGVTGIDVDLTLRRGD